MQYILTETEYNSLREKQSRLSHIDGDELQKLCTAIAKTMPVGDRPWGCILVDRINYCDNCPVTSICPNPWKEWSK